MEHELSEVATVARTTLEAVRAQASQDHDILVRVDEKVSAIHERLDVFENGMKEHEKSDKETFVTKTEFEPFRKGFYWAVGTIIVTLVGIVGSLISLIIK